MIALERFNNNVQYKKMTLKEIIYSLLEESDKED